MARTVLTEDKLRKITLGVYQLKQTPLYAKEHINNENKYQLQVCKIKENLLKVYALSRCPESLSTVVNVVSCPKNKAEWERQSKQKDCSKVFQSCVKPEDFLYHCLINEYMNMTIEVCAPSVSILGQKCAEFNTVGAIVQDNVYAKCDDSDPPCPFRYNSTDLYKYQRCYSYIKSTNNTHVLPSCSDDTRSPTDFRSGR
ncbi:uncharacterized protein LOC133186228 [Saccostrea echinata]|uniref:uncharacterized protein LOC133186228 n=1 Tax=Saccostrea echinata TaxID=191078 RepID=UPI002A7F6758|nr:uncharacterized protein LOC133186228 [Saccostrea echinata]